MPPAAPLTILVVDDEPPARRRLLDLLAGVDGVGEVLEAGDGATAVRMIADHRPDAVFLDMQMPGRSGLDVVAAVGAGSMPVTVFVTAYDQYALRAFEADALDYLLKPVAISELVLAVNKAEEKLKDKEKNQQLNFLLNHAGSKAAPSKIALPQLHEIRYVTISDIVRCEADNSYTFFHLSNGERILVSRSIKEYTDMLKPIGFLRTHQSHLVNIAFVKSWLKEDGGVLLLNNGDKVSVSKPNKAVVQQALSYAIS